MKTIKISPEQMAKRTAKFADLRPYSEQHDDSTGIPRAAMEKLTAHRVYPIMVPPSYTGRSAMAPLKTSERIVLAIAECPPDNGPGLHNHEITTENFMCLQGRFRVCWGDEGENCLTLEPLDFVSITPGVARNFHNISNETGRLLAIIETASDGSNDRVAYAPAVADELTEEFGPDTLAALKQIGFKFDSGVDA